jgi:hypothetical protein
LFGQLDLTLSILRPLLFAAGLGDMVGSERELEVLGHSRESPDLFLSAQVFSKAGTAQFSGSPGPLGFS